MLEAPVPESEDERQRTLDALRILDTSPEERFDRLTRIAKRMFDVPISLISLIDHERQWFKSKQGLEANETPRNISFCGHAILDDDTFVIPNALKDARFNDNPLVKSDPNIRFYAGVPLRMSNGEKIGTLCLIDKKPRQLNAEDVSLLEDLATMVEQEIASMQLATIDDLTKISNRRGFFALAERALTFCKRSQRPASLILFDLDDFKPINDTHGHAEGDAALIAFADMMQQGFRESDVFARLGGDEFVALLTNSDAGDVEDILTRFSHLLDEYNKHNPKPYTLSFSAGVANIPHDSEYDLASHIAIADENMYKEKLRKKDSTNT
ncbi:sensor domain-containing diguanylate cyclase [Aestuariibacter sp. AA17]|uniref:Sensor domain-containing diguanylate cyclase n=1 Tax=Fluctibacter corallii TaxID=2984329 RepID=A0ABT3ADC4_9ALTE|nr:sensor domain-containing diguanylate cyclase [Aestuariibacter sp. AA17]MCV2886671.1 sensor domain-containing diguanylate cyclase [Aestuariibacter sp. AA17]